MTVSIGQVWGDKDKRRIGRTFEIKNIDAVANVAECQILTAGLSQGRESIKISLNRFIPKYYFLKTKKDTPVRTDLVERCDELMSGNWKTPKTGYAVLDHGDVCLLVREVNATTFDVKIHIDEVLIRTFVNRVSLFSAFEEVKSIMTPLRDSFSKFLS